MPSSELSIFPQQNYANLSEGHVRAKRVVRSGFRAVGGCALCAFKKNGDKVKKQRSADLDVTSPTIEAKPIILCDKVRFPQIGLSCFDIFHACSILPVLPCCVANAPRQLNVDLSGKKISSKKRKRT